MYFPSIGSSPVRKCMAAVEARTESFNIDFNVSLINMLIGFNNYGFKTNVEKADNMIEHIKSSIHGASPK